MFTDCMLLSDRADVVFLLDTSSSVYEPDFEKMKVFLSEFVDLFTIDIAKQRVASLTFSDEVRINFYLNDYYSNEEVKVIMPVAK